MGFFSDDGLSGFDKMFDFNHDGRLDAGERGMQLGFINHILESEDDNDGQMGTGCGFEDDEEDELKIAGLDPDDFDDDEDED